LNSIVIISSPGKKIYTKIKSLWKKKNGLGIFLLSTNQGLSSDEEARYKNLGGLLLCSIT
jgi:small subunit ribosomal protein S8